MLRMYQRPAVPAPLRAFISGLARAAAAEGAAPAYSGAGGTTTIIVRDSGPVPSFR
jgi:hypothetical protein